MSIKNLTFRLLGEDKSASSSMTHAQETAEKVTGRIGGTFSKLGGVIGGEFGEVLNRVGEGIESVGEKTHSASAVMMGAGAVVTGLGGALMAAGSADKQANDQLQNAIKNSGHSYEEYREEIEKTIKTQENYGHGAADTQQALQKMTTAFQDPKKALEDMGLVANLAASKHISLAAAADLVVKITSGKGTRTLSEYGITLGKSKDKAKDAEVALGQLAAKVNGQASASVDNFSAKVGIVRTKLGDWVAEMGNQFGPVMTAAGPVLMVVAAAMDIFKAASLGARLASLGQAVATGVSTAAQWAFNAAMDANPIMIVVLAIAALVAGLVWFFTQTKLGQQIWKNFTSFVGTVVHWLWNSVIHPVFTAIGAIFNWLYKNVINPIVVLIKLEFWAWGQIFHWLYDNAIHPVFNAISGIFHWLYDNVIHPVVGVIKNAIVGAGIVFHQFYDNTIHPVAVWIGNALTNIKNGFSTVFGAIGGIIRGAFNGVVGFVRGIFNGVIDTINGVIGAINNVGGVAKTLGLGGFSISKIPHMALGGVVTKPTVALIGESGPEAVEPLHHGPGELTDGGGLHIHVTVQAGVVGDERMLAQTVLNALTNGVRGGRVNARDFKTAMGIA